MVMMKFCWIILLLVSQIEYCCCSASIEIELVKYKNNDGYGHDGSECSGRGSRCKCVFNICLQSASTAKDISCVKTKQFDEDWYREVSFSSSLGNGLVNPLVIQLSKVESNYQLSFEIINTENSKIYDRIVEAFPAAVSLDNSKTFQTFILTKSMNEKFPKSVQIKVGTYCNQGYKPPLCNERLCVPRDDNLGHYQCMANGTKYCLPGWKNISSNCLEKVCIPRNDATGHFSCLSNGTKACLAGWRNVTTNCLVKICIPQNDTNGHYYCATNGTKICLSGWKNVTANCTEKVCIAKNNSDGHFSCLRNGSKICLPGWRNVSINCLEKICTPRNDLKGHYKCFINGTKQCLQGWKNVSNNCLEKTCEARDNEYGHYTCLQNGTKVCLPGWRNKSIDCLERICVPKNDSMGHYSCLKNGTKVCLDGWRNLSNNCLEKICSARNDSLGHYTCSSDHMKICLPGWKNVLGNCLEKLCTPRNDSYGHYTCSENGTKTCLPGWENARNNCVRRMCTPKNNTEGHYRCLGNGTKICLPGWENATINCLVRCCTPKNNSEGHYICLENGTKVCLQGWKNTTVDCKVKDCIAKNDSEGHYFCSENGTKICLKGWLDISRNCLVKAVVNPSTTSIETVLRHKTSSLTMPVQATSSFVLMVSQGVVTVETVTDERSGYRQANIILVVVTGVCIFTVIVFSIVLCCQRRGVMKKLRQQQAMIDELASIGMSSMSSPREMTYTEISLDNLEAAESRDQTNKELMETSYGVHEGFHNPLMCRKPFTLNSGNIETVNDLYHHDNQPKRHPTKRPSIGPQTLENEYTDMSQITGRPSIFEFPPLPPKKLLKMNKKQKKSRRLSDYKYDLPPPPSLEETPITEGVIYDSIAKDNSRSERQNEPIMSLLDEFKEKFSQPDDSSETNSRKHTDDGYDSWGNDEHLKLKFQQFSCQLHYPPEDYD